MLSVFKDNVLIADEMPVKANNHMKTIFSVMLRQSLTRILLSRTVRNLSLAEKKLVQNHPFELRAYLESIETVVVVVDDDDY